MATTAEEAAAAQQKKGVDERSEWLAEDDAAHDLARTLRRGVPAMRRAAKEYRYMWPNPGEMEKVEVGGGKSATLYQLRIDNSDMPDPWGTTIRSTARLPFRSRIILEGWDTEIQGTSEKPGWSNSLTAENQGLDEYAASIFEDALFDGVAFTFVDNDPRKFPDAASRAAAKAQPRITKFLRNHIRRLTFEESSGVQRLKQVVFDQPDRNVNIEDPNAWVDEMRESRKVITAGDLSAPPGSEERKVRTRVYFKNDQGQWYEETSKRGFITPESPKQELTEIPLVPHYTNRTGPYRGTCPFLDSAYTQEAIWKLNSWMINLAREASLTHIHESGVNIDPETKKPILADTRNMRYHYSTDPQAKLDVHEMKGSALLSVRQLIEWKIRTVEKAHHQIQVDKPTGPVTAREITLEGVQASSALEMWVIFQEQAWKKILDYVALLGGLSKRGRASIPHDFGLPNSGMERNHQLFLAGVMSPDAYWGEAMRAGDVDEKFNIAKEISWHRKNMAESGGPTEDFGT